MAPSGLERTIVRVFECRCSGETCGSRVDDSSVIDVFVRPPIRGEDADARRSRYADAAREAAEEIRRHTNEEASGSLQQGVPNDATNRHGKATQAQGFRGGTRRLRAHKRTPFRPLDVVWWWCECDTGEERSTDREGLDSVGDCRAAAAGALFRETKRLSAANAYAIRSHALCSFGDGGESLPRHSNPPEDYEIYRRACSAHGASVHLNRCRASDSETTTTGLGVCLGNGVPRWRGRLAIGRRGRRAPEHSLSTSLPGDEESFLGCVSLSCTSDSLSAKLGESGDTLRVVAAGLTSSACMGSRGAGKEWGTLSTPKTSTNTHADRVETLFDALRVAKDVCLVCEGREGKRDGEATDSVARSRRQRRLFLLRGGGERERQEAAEGHGSHTCVIESVSSDVALRFGRGLRSLASVVGSSKTPEVERGLNRTRSQPPRTPKLREYTEKEIRGHWPSIADAVMAASAAVARGDADSVLATDTEDGGNAEEQLDADDTDEWSLPTDLLYLEDSGRDVFGGTVGGGPVREWERRALAGMDGGEADPLASLPFVTPSIGTRGERDRDGHRTKRQRGSSVDTDGGGRGEREERERETSHPPSSLVPPKRDAPTATQKSVGDRSVAEQLELVLACFDSAGCVTHDRATELRGVPRSLGPPQRVGVGGQKRTQPSPQPLGGARSGEFAWRRVAARGMMSRTWHGAGGGLPLVGVDVCEDAAAETEAERNNIYVARLEDGELKRIVGGGVIDNRNFFHARELRAAVKTFRGETTTSEARPPVSRRRGKSGKGGAHR